MGTAWPDKDDNELLALIQDGSSQAFALLVERPHRALLPPGLSLRSEQGSGRRHGSGTPFLSSGKIRHRWQADKNAKFTTWFYRVVVNLCPRLAKEKAAGGAQRGYADH